MNKRFLISFSAITACLIFSISMALAQDTVNVTANEDVTSVDLGVSEPTVLPDSPWYGLKKWWETIIDSFKINPIKQAERSLDRASERLMEIRGLVDQKKITQERADQLIANYQKHIDKIKERLAKFQDQESDRKEKFLDKLAEYQLKHQKILDRISDDGFDSEKVKIAKEKALAVWGEALSKTDNEKITERLEKAMEKIEGGDLKEMKNLEILKLLEEKVPEPAKSAIQAAQINALKRLKSDINRLPEEKRAEAIKEYIEKIGGDEAMYLEIINDLSAGGELKPQAINEIRQELREKVRARADERENETEDENETDNVDENANTNNANQ